MCRKKERNLAIFLPKNSNFMAIENLKKPLILALLIFNSYFWL
jgi:hypothetical protein